MKKLFLCAALFYTSLTIPKLSDSAHKVYKQQLDLVAPVIKHAQNNLIDIAPWVVHKSEATSSLQALYNFLKVHPEALECVVDTFQLCLEEKCMNIPDRVQECIDHINNADKSMLYPDPEQLQQKISSLIIFYFNFQLTPLGAVDHYSQDYFRRTGMSTAISLITPVVHVISTYYALSYALTLFKDYSIFKEQKNNHKMLQDITNNAFSITAAALFVPEVKSSIEKLSKYTRENINKNYARLINKIYKSSYPTKPSKENFSTIRGYEETKLLFIPLIDFCTHLAEYRATDLKIPRGYLLVGDLNDGRKIAQALAGEISEQLKINNSAEEYMIYEIHASALIHQKFDASLKECLEYGPTVVIINNIDWIYTQKDVDPAVYSHIINSMSRYTAQDSNYPLIICATSKNHTVIDPVMLEQNRLEIIKLS